MTLFIQEINAQHDQKIASIITAVGQEFAAIGEGFGPSDSEVQAMSEHYGVANKSRYYVALLDGQVVGGAGIAPFNHSDDMCELRKLFLLPEARHLGIGRTLTETCLQYAQTLGYTSCYLDTLSTMDAACRLYEKLGFDYLAQPLAGTIHGACDIWMLKKWARVTP